MLKHSIAEVHFFFSFLSVPAAGVPTADGSEAAFEWKSKRTKTKKMACI